MKVQQPQQPNPLSIKKYDIQFQMFILSQIFSSGEVYARCRNILKPKYFDREFAVSIDYVNAYTAKHNGVMPTIEEIEIYGEFKYQKLTVEQQRQQAVLDSVGEFCKHKALALAVEESMDLIREKRYGGIEELIRTAMLVGIQNELGLDIYEDPEATINALKDTMGTFKTGWETLDHKLFGGFGRQELEIFAAASGGGKSVVMQNLAINFSRDGKTGAYITLELANELVATRMYGMMTDSLQKTVKTAPSDIAAKIALERIQNGAIHIKRLPESVSTVNDIESYLRELEIKTGTKLDYVCVDYLDLLTSDRCGPNDRSNAFVKDKFVSEELRALAMKMDLTVVTACQFNRSGVAGEDVRSQAQIAGGISKIYTADNVIFIDTKKELGEIIFDFQKTRNSSAVGSKLRLAYSMDSLRIFDHQMTVDEMSKFGFVHSKPHLVRGFNNIRSSPQPLPQSVVQNPIPSSSQPINTVNPAPKSEDTSRRDKLHALLNRN